MRLIPSILYSLDDFEEFDLLRETVEKLFPSATQKRTDHDELINLLKTESFNLLIMESDPQEVARFQDRLRFASPYLQNLVTVLIIPEDKPEYIKIALESGIFLYIHAPISKSELLFTMSRAREALQIRMNSTPRQLSGKRAPIAGFIGASPAMEHLFRLIQKIAEDDFSTVLIRGESGTGKELVAKAIHSKSKRKNHNFVPVNCAAIPDELLESELFGHLKGAFTGASQTKIGRIQYADQGTLFLDEIGDMKPNLQAKLLRVLQEKEFEPVGSLKATPVNTRIVAATHCDLEELVRKGEFREDLYYRLSVVPLEVPPLRDRVEDIPLLLDEFIRTYTVNRGRSIISFSPETVSILGEYEWRGNVRELENLVQHMSILYSGRTIKPRNLPEKFTRNLDVETIGSPLSNSSHMASSPLDISRERADLFAPIASSEPEIDLENGPIDFNHIIHEFESDLILKAMRFTSGNKKEAARMLSLKRTTLLEKIKKKGLEGLWEL